MPVLHWLAWTPSRECSCHLWGKQGYFELLAWPCTVGDEFRAVKQGDRFVLVLSDSFALWQFTGTPTTVQHRCLLAQSSWALLASWWRWQTGLSPCSLQHGEPVAEASSCIACLSPSCYGARLSAREWLRFPGVHRVRSSGCAWSAAPRGDAAAEMREKMHFIGFVLLGDTLITRCTATSSSSPPHPLPNKIFSLRPVFVWFCIFPWLVFSTEISGLLLSPEVFWSAGGFVGLRLYRGRERRHWGEGHAIVSWKSAFRFFFYKYQLKNCLLNVLCSIFLLSQWFPCLTSTQEIPNLIDPIFLCWLKL